MARKKNRKGFGAVLRMVFTGIAISVTAVLLGYAVGHIAIRAVTQPLLTETAQKPQAEERYAAAQEAPATQPQSAAPSATPSEGKATRSAAQPAPVPQPVAAPRPASPGDEAADPVVPAMAPVRPQTAQPAAQPQPSARLWRVRVGRFDSRSEAEAELARVQLSVPEARLVHDGGYRIQAGAFSDQSRAEALAASLNRRGFVAEVTAVY